MVTAGPYLSDEECAEGTVCDRCMARLDPDNNSEAKVRSDRLWWKANEKRVLAEGAWRGARGDVVIPPWLEWLWND